MVVIVVHGGAAKQTPSLMETKLSQIRRSAKTGFIELLLNKYQSTAALDAVEQAVKFMEDSPYFNAGYGSSLTSTGQVEMDAIIADGSKLNFGAVASVTDFSNPISIARKVLDCSQHCLFTREGAHQMALKHGFQSIANHQLISEQAKERLAKFKTFDNTINIDKGNDDSDHDTVGSVAVDWFGNMAAATSTGGITGKLPGRIGDSPIIGSGAYADNETGAVSTTGHGEAIMRVCLARQVLYRYQELINETNLKVNPMQMAVKECLQLMQTRVDGYGGIIAVGNGFGDIGIDFNTESMPWAYVAADDNNIEQLTEQLNNSDCNKIDSIKVLIHYGCQRNEHLTVLE